MWLILLFAHTFTHSLTHSVNLTGISSKSGWQRRLTRVKLALSRELRVWWGADR